MSESEQAILENLDVFVAFARKRLGDPHLAEDAVQDSLLKALAADRKPIQEENSVAWFYRILRRSIIDLYRRKDARERALERFARELPETPRAADERLLCQCVKRLLPGLPEASRLLLQEIDLEGGDLGDVAAHLGISRNNAGVRLHRARKQLRDALRDTCRACSQHGCLDCTCEEAREISTPNND